MFVFEDAAGRQWTVRLTLGAVRDVKQTVGVDLLDPGQAYPTVTDPQAMAECVWALLAPQAEEKGVSQEEWLAAIDGECLGTLHESWVEELADFFRGPMLEKLSEAIRHWREEMRRTTVEQLKQMAEQVSGGSSGSVRESQGSTPGP